MNNTENMRHFMNVVTEGSNRVTLDEDGMIVLSSGEGDGRGAFAQIVDHNNNIRITQPPDKEIVLSVREIWQLSEWLRSTGQYEKMNRAERIGDDNYE